MTQPFDPNRLQFYLTIPSPCPYLPGRMERKIFTQLEPLTGPHLNNYLTHAGFRRSQNVIYRPACETCRECRSLRIRTAEFSPGKYFRRILNANADLTLSVEEAIATEEQYDLLHHYLISRHHGGGMSEMDFIRYEMMVEELVYSFFDPDIKKRSLGNLMILDQIKRCQEQGLPYLYLGYWVEGSPKMDYKARFTPCEILGAEGWTLMDSKT